MILPGRLMCGVAIFLIVYTFGSAWAAIPKPAVRENGSIEVDGRIFSDLRAFHSSDYFRTHGYRCGTKPVKSTATIMLERSISDCTTLLTRIQSEYWPEETYQLPVWFHVITNSSGDGNISEARIRDQIEVLNEDFRAIAGSMGANGFDVKIQFVLAGIDKTVNDTWFYDNDEYGYKNFLKRDPNTYINIYTNTASGYLGYAYLPQDIASGAIARVYDGIVLFWESVGGRNNGYEDYNQGRTLVHEMGHYLGLLHTFESGDCSNSYASGDLILDTNAQDVATQTCTSLSTCAGTAPIHNYMDYSFDSCMWQFSREQANRAVCSLVNFRPDIYTIVQDNAQQSPAMAPLLLPLLLKEAP